MIYPQATAPLAVANPLFGLGPGVGIPRSTVPTGGPGDIVQVTEGDLFYALIHTGEPNGFGETQGIIISGTGIYDGATTVLSVVSPTAFLIPILYAGNATGTVVLDGS